MRPGSCLLLQLQPHGRLSSVFAAALSPLGLVACYLAEGGIRMACSATAADRVALSGSPDAFVRKKLAPTLRRRRQCANLSACLPAAPAVPRLQLAP